MPCTFCTSGDQREFPAEVHIHFPGISNAGEPGVFVFPKLLLCLKCGFTSFMTPDCEVAQLCAADTNTTSLRGR